MIISTIVGSIMDAKRLIKQNQAQNDNNYNNIIVKNQYAINIPAFLSPMKNLSEDASLQYGNKTLDIAFLVIDEPKSEFIAAVKESQPTILGLGISIVDNLATVAINNMFEVDKVEVGNYTQTTINGLNAITLNVFQKRTFFKDAAYGSFAFIEGKDRLYQIIIMSGGTSIRKLADKLETAIHSFKEL